MTEAQVTLSRPVDVSIGAPDWIRQLAALLRRVSPREGWDTFLLLFGAVGVSAWVVREADFVETPGLMVVIFLACLVGMLLAKTRRVIWVVPFIAGLLIGAVVATYQTSLLVEEGTLTGVVAVWERVREWLNDAVSGGISRDLLPSTLILLTFAWLLGYLSAWALFRWFNPWVGLMLSGVALLTTLSFLPDRYDSRFIVFVFIAMMLVARLNIVQRERAWMRTGIGAITSMRSRLMSAPIILAVTAIILIAAVGAPLRVFVVRSAIDLWNWGRDPLTVFEDDFARLFSGITSKNDLDGRFFGDTLPFQGKISFGGDVVMVANSQSPTYWLSRSYNEYTSRGWISGKTITSNVGPQSLPPPPHESDNRELAFQRVLLTFDSDELFVGGNVDWISHDAVVETLEPKVFEIDLRYSASDSEMPPDIQELAVEIRSALSPPANRFVDSIVAAIMPDDLVVLSVDPGSESSDWRNQKSVTLRRKDPEFPEVVNWGFKDMLPKEQPYTLYSFISRVDNSELNAAVDDYPRFITDHYLQLPASLPARVRDLAERITAGEETPLQKAMAIERYLRSEGGFVYSQDIEAPPPDADGVDWFLFETKTGYSDYFGSSMTVMLRSVGVPARMAAGYAPGKRLQETGTWTILDKDSHGWSQAYFPGHGWIDFEPTTAWAAVDRGPVGGLEGEPEAVAEGADAIELPEGQISDSPSVDECELLEQADPEEAEALGCNELLDDGIDYELLQDQRSRGPLSLALPGAIVLGVVAALWLLAWFLWNLGLGKREPEERYYVKMSRLGMLAGVRRQIHHTPIEYAAAVAVAVPNASQEARSVGWSFAVGRYSRRESALDLNDTLRQSWKKIRGGLLLRTLKRIAPVGGFRV